MHVISSEHPTAPDSPVIRHMLAILAVPLMLNMLNVLTLPGILILLNNDD